MSKSKYFSILDSLTETDSKPASPNDRVLLVDGLNTFIRAFSVNPSLNEDGSHVAGLVGFLKSIRFAINKFKPLRIMNIAMINIYHAIPVEKNCTFLFYDKNSLMYFF